MKNKSLDLDQLKTPENVAVDVDYKAPHIDFVLRQAIAEAVKNILRTGAHKRRPESDSRYLYGCSQVGGKEGFDTLRLPYRLGVSSEVDRRISATNVVENDIDDSLGRILGNTDLMEDWRDLNDNPICVVKPGVDRRIEVARVEAVPGSDAELLANLYCGEMSPYAHEAGGFCMEGGLALRSSARCYILKKGKPFFISWYSDHRQPPKDRVVEAYPRIQRHNEVQKVHAIRVPGLPKNPDIDAILKELAPKVGVWFEEIRT